MERTENMTSKCVDCKYHRILDVAYNRKVQGLIIRHSCTKKGKDIHPFYNPENYCELYETHDLANPVDAPIKSYEEGEVVT